MGYFMEKSRAAHILRAIPFDRYSDKDGTFEKWQGMVLFFQIGLLQMKPFVLTSRPWEYSHKKLHSRVLICKNMHSKLERFCIFIGKNT